MLAGEHASGTPQAGLHLVADQQDVMALADFGAAGEIPARRNDDAAFALDRLDQERGGVARDCALERMCVAERDALEPGRERTEAVAILRFRRHADDGDRAAVEIA